MNHQLVKYEINSVILYPSSLIIKLWNIIYFLILVVQFSIIPLSYSFYIAAILFFILKLIDAIINSCSAFAINGQFVNQLNEIVLHYCRKYLFFDLVIQLIMIGVFNFIKPYDRVQCFLLDISHGSIFKFNPKIVKFTVISVLVTFILHNSEYNFFHPTKQLIILLLRLALFIHFLTCLWESNFYNGDEIEFRYRYIKSLYISLNIITFNSVQIEIESNEQILTFCFFSILSLLMFAYLLTKFIIIFKDDKLSQKLSNFMNENNLDTILKHKIISHFINQPTYHHNQFVSKLSNQLNEEYNYSQRYELVCKYFHNYNKNTIKEIVNQSQEIVCHPNQLILEEGILDDCSLYFILEGTVYFESKSQLKLQTLQQKDSFGEIQFYTEFPRNYSVRSEGVTRLFKITRSTFISLLTFHDKVHQINKQQIFSHTRDLIIFKNNFPRKCVCCLSATHIITGCPFLTFKADTDKVLKQFLFPHRQLRQQVQRRKQKDMRTFSFYQQAPQYEIAFLQLFSDQLQMSQISQSQLPYDDICVRDSMVSARDRSLSKQSREKSILKSTSFMKQQSGYEQQSQPNNNDNIFANLDQDHEFSVINSSKDNQYDEFANLVRTDQQKRTFATAGFGTPSLMASNKDLTQKSLNIIMEHADSDQNSESKSNENLDDSVQEKFSRKNRDPKLTFNYNFETQMNELEKQNHPKLSRLGSGSQYRQQSSRNSTIRYPDVVSSRQNSSRSLTYSPIPSNGQQKSRLTSSPNGVRKSTFSFPSKQIQNYKQFEITTVDGDAKSQSKRQPYRKISTKTGTRISIIPSSFQPFSNLEVYISSIKNPPYSNIGIVNFEAMYQFDSYFPHNNYTVAIAMQVDIILRANKFQNEKIVLSRYISDYKVAKMIYKLKLRRLKSMRTKTQTKIE